LGREKIQPQLLVSWKKRQEKGVAKISKGAKTL